MSSSTTLRPDGVIQQSGTNTPSTSTIQAVLSDNSDATYVSQNDAFLQLSVNDFTFPAGATITSVTLRVKCMVQNFTGGQYAFWLGVGPNVGAWGPWLTPTNMTAQVFQCPTMTVRPDGQAWSQADINNIFVNIQNGGNIGYSGPDGYLYEVYVDVVYNTVPVVVGTGPNATVATTRPTFTWTYTDDDVQERYRIKVFDADQIALPGFDPNTFTPLIDSGEQFSSATSWTPSTDIANGKTVRAYLYVSDTGSNGRYNTVTVSGPYAYCTLDLAPTSQSQPAMPRVQATRDNTNQRWVITALDAQNMLDTNTADAETSLVGWVGASGTFSTVARNISAAGNHGLARYSLTNSSAGAGGAASASLGINGTKVVPNTVYSASAHFKAAVTARSCFVAIYWYDSTGASISNDNGPTVTNSTSAWTPAYVTAAAPSNAAYAIVRVLVNSMATSEVQYFDTVQLVPGVLNMLPNPIFETSGGGNSSGVGVIASYWTNTNNGAPSSQVYSIDSTVYKAGERSQKLVWSGGISTTLIGLSSFSIQPVVTSGSQYRVRAYVKSAQTTEFSLSASNMSGSATVIVAAADGWTILEYDGVATASGNSVLTITAKGAAGTVWFGYMQMSYTYLGGAATYTLSAPYLQWSGGSMVSAARFQLQRSLDSGASWTTVVRAPWLQPTESGNPRVTDYTLGDYDDTYQSMTLYDYEVPKGKTPIYRVRSIVTIAGQAVASQWSFATSPFIPLDPVNPLMWWIKCPFAPWLNFQFDFEGPTWARTNTEEAAFFGPISRTRSVRVSDVIRGDKFSLTVFGTSWAIIDAIVAIRRTQKPVLLQAPDGREWWVAFGPDESVDEQLLASRTDNFNPYQKLTYTFEEVDAPIY